MLFVEELAVTAQESSVRLMCPICHGRVDGQGTTKVGNTVFCTSCLDGMRKEAEIKKQPLTFVWRDHGGHIEFCDEVYFGTRNIL